MFSCCCIFVFVLWFVFVLCLNMVLICFNVLSILSGLVVCCIVMCISHVVLGFVLSY
jgi:hypothetical protein